MKNFLIATALEETWPERKDIPVIFLGEWCRLFHRREIWSGMRAKVLPYHWDNRKKLYRDYLFLSRTYEEELLPELSFALNNFHGTNWSDRYWRILIGPWLGYFTQMVFDRFEVLKKAYATGSISGFRRLSPAVITCPPADSAAFTRLYPTDFWNQGVFDFIQLNEFGKTGEAIESASLMAKFDPSKTETENNQQPLTQRFIKKAINFESRLWVRSNEAFIISDYLPRKLSLRLQMALGQMPRLRRRIIPQLPSQDIHRKLFKLENTPGKPGFGRLIRQLIPLQIPQIFLEGYKNLIKESSRQQWPKKPRFIFTANNQYNDDLFQAWAAEKAETGTRFVLGQHGGHYGTGKWSFHEDHEISVSDRYLSWGWTDQKKVNIRQAVCLPIPEETTLDYDRKGGVVVVTTTIPRYSYWMYSVMVARQWLDYFEDQVTFTRNLLKHIRASATIRLYSRDFGWDQKLRWTEACPDVTLDDGRIKMKTLMQKSRLYVSTYNATTFLESMRLGMPTVFFWNPAHWELRPEAKPFFDRLAEVGIFHKSPQTAAKHVNKIWDDVDLWWNSTPVSAARREFCGRFAAADKNALSTLMENLNS